jgi:anti-sigma-K factor RskA
MKHMDHDAYRELIPAYALGATDAEEVERLDAHLGVCKDCLALLSEYQQLHDDLLWTVRPVTAPPHLALGLRQRLVQEGRTSRRDSWLMPLRLPALAGLAAAMVLLVVSNLYWYSRTAQTEQQVSVQATAIAALAVAPSVELQGDAPAPNARGSLHFRPDSNIAVLRVYEMPALAEDKAYQVWLLRDGQRDSGGLFQVEQGEGILVITSPRPLREYQGLGITVEPVGGSLGPTSPRVIGGTL